MNIKKVYAFDSIVNDNLQAGGRLVEKSFNTWYNLETFAYKW